MSSPEIDRGSALIIAAKERNTVIYIRDGVRCQISDTIRHELWITDGFLEEDATKKVIFVTVDVQR